MLLSDFRRGYEDMRGQLEFLRRLGQDYDPSRIYNNPKLVRDLEKFLESRPIDLLFQLGDFAYCVVHTPSILLELDDFVQTAVSLTRGINDRIRGLERIKTNNR